AGAAARARGLRFAALGCVRRGRGERFGLVVDDALDAGREPRGHVRRRRGAGGEGRDPADPGGGGGGGVRHRNRGGDRGGGRGDRRAGGRGRRRRGGRFAGRGPGRSAAG